MTSIVVYYFAIEIGAKHCGQHPCMSACISQKPRVQTPQKFSVHVMYVAMAQFSCDNSVRRCVLWLSMTSCFHMIEHMRCMAKLNSFSTSAVPLCALPPTD